MGDKLFSALSLCKKAGALAAGFDQVVENAAAGKAHLLLFAADLSPNTRKRALEQAPGLPVCNLPFTQEALAAITRKPVGVLAVNNKDLAVLCLRSATEAGQPNKEEPV
ncbi:MAG: L7Ae/L30e/S12e/Gadd45 family ribosomal protein [Oscillospiraceae bacterium]